MTNTDRLQALYDRIPTFECVEGCHDCCKRPGFSPDEWEAIEEKREATGPECPYVEAGRCAIYGQRPFVCRLFGAAELLPCPRGRGPEKPLSPEESGEMAREYGRILAGREVWIMRGVGK